MNKELKLFLESMRYRSLISEVPMSFDDKNPVGKPHSNIIKKIEQRKGHPFADIDFLHKKGDNNQSTIEKLGSEEFDDASKDYQKHKGKISSYEAMSLAIKIEIPNTKRLEYLAKNTVQKYFGIPAELMQNVKVILTHGPIKWKGNLKEGDFTEKDLLANFNDDEKRIIKQQVNKRVIANALMMGAGFRAHNLLEKIKDEIDEIDERLFPLYNALMSGHAIDLWKNEPTDKIEFNIKPPMQENVGSRMLGGQSYLILGKDVNGDGIRDVEGAHAEAIVFPVLLHETVKAVIEYLFANGLPQYRKEMNRAIIQQADQLHFEHWHKLLGPRLWKYLHDAIDFIVKGRDSDYSIVAYLLQEISILPPEKFLQLMDDVLHNGDRAIAFLTQMVDGIEDDLNNPGEPAPEPEVPDFAAMNDLMGQIQNILNKPEENADDVINHKPFDKMSLPELKNYISLAIEKGEYDLAAEARDELEKRMN